MWRIQYSTLVVEDDISRLDQVAKKRIEKAIENKLIKDPLHFGKPLRHSLHNLRSLRVGDYRVLYHLDNDAKLVSIVSIGHRKNIYER